MQTKVRAKGRVSGVAMDVEANQAGGLLTALGDADYTDITRGGHAFHVKAATGVPSLAAIATIATAFMCWNSAPDGGKSMIIDALFAVADDGSDALSSYFMIYVLGQTRVATVADELTPRRNNGLGATTDTIAICAEGGNLDGVTGVAIGWMPVGNSITQAIVSQQGSTLWAEVNGRIIIPPGRAFGMHTIAADANSDFECGMMWHEKQIKLA